MTYRQNKRFSVQFYSACIYQSNALHFEPNVIHNTNSSIETEYYSIKVRCFFGGEVIFSIIEFLRKE